MESSTEISANLHYEFVLEDKYIYVYKKDSQPSKGKGPRNEPSKGMTASSYTVKSPYLKVLKAKHEFKNKNYLIVQLDMDLDVDERVEKFVKEIRNMDEISKEILMHNSKAWYGKKWDIFTLDSMTRCPIDEQKGIFYMKIIIDKENKELGKRIETLEKMMEENQSNDLFISLQTSFKGMRWSREIFSEEWYLEDFYVLEEEKEVLDQLAATFGGHVQDGGDGYDDQSVSQYMMTDCAGPDLHPEEPIVEEEPIVQEPVVEEPVVEKPVVEEPVVEEPVVQKFVTEKEVVIQEPVIQEPVPQEEVVQEPVIQEPVPQEEVVQEPVPQEPVLQELPSREEVVQEPITKEIPIPPMAKLSKKSKTDDFRKKGGNDAGSVVSALSTTSSKRVKKVFTMNGKLVR